jgi:DNA mismatch repair protein MutH
MQQLRYNPNEKQSIIAFAKLLKGKSLRESCGVYILDHGYKGKGNWGQVLEKYYFGYEPNNESEPDFPIAGIELKSTPLKQLKNKDFRSKERLVLNSINYKELVTQVFATSAFYRKNSCLLLVFYLHNIESNMLDYLIKLVDEWNFTDTDLEVIKKDWEFIKNKVRLGKAHELSEGDTFYLGACTKGANATPNKKQPFSNILAKQRAFSFKQGYVNHIIATIAKEPEGIYGKLIPSVDVAKAQTIEQIVISKFTPYLNKSVGQIIEETGAVINPKSKDFYAKLTKVILGIGVDKEIEEFEKADIISKTVRIIKNNLPKEDISFPTFKFIDIVKENWDYSSFKNLLERKFFFVFYTVVDNQLFLKKVQFWNMPYNDVCEAQKVWDKAKHVILNGTIVKEIKKGKRYTNFPNKKANVVSHVRPHAKNALDTYPLPIVDKLTGAKKYTKQCFWLNNSYVRDEIYLK